VRSIAKGSSAGSTQRQASGLGRTGIALSCLLAVLAFAGSSASSSLAAVTPKGINGFFGLIAVPFDEPRGGMLRAPNGTAVNESNGKLYVAETDQNDSRISVFDSSGTFLRAFGQDVVESGPGETGTGFEICVPANGDVCKRGTQFAPRHGGVMNAPSGVALDSSGNVYVSDDTERVQKFDADGNFLLAFGQDVVESGPGDTGTGFEICVAADGDVCQTGVSASTGGAFATSFSTAANLTVAPAGAPNEGNLLVTDPGNRRVQEFTPAGGFVRAFGFDVKVGGVETFEVCEVAAECKEGAAGSGAGQFADETPTNIAEDAAGNIYTVEPTTNFRVQKFTLPGNVVTPQGTFAEAHLSGTSAADGPLAVAIDPATEDVLVAKAFPAGSTASCPNTGDPSVAERRIVEVSAAGALEATHMACAGIDVARGIAVRGSTGEVFVSSETSGWGIFVLNTPLDLPSVGLSGISDVDAHNATVSGFVNPNGPEALPYGPTTSYHVNFKRSADSTFSQTADLDVGKGTANQLFSKRLASLEAGTAYDVQIVANKPFVGTVATAIFSFTTPVAPAEVGFPSATTAATEGGDVRAALYGSVAPNSQPTTYRFEYGTTTAYGTQVPPAEKSVGAGPVPVPVAQFLDGLQPETTYHFRLVAKNPAGTAASSDSTFTTPPLGSSLPDNRGYELVSPADKGPAGSVAELGFAEQVFGQASLDGNSVVYPIQNGIPESTAGGWTRWRADRTASGWLSTQLSAPALVPAPEIGDGGSGFIIPSSVLYASPDLGCAILESYEPLTEDVPPLSIQLGTQNLFRRNADGSHDLISDRVPLNPKATTTGGGFYRQIEASDDCSRIYFKTNYELMQDASGLYEWDEGTLRDAGVRPDGSVGPNLGDNDKGAVMGGEAHNASTGRWNAVSPDGSRLFFSAISNEGTDSGGRAVFMREEGGASVIDISQSKTAVPTNGARFEAASADGSRVFFVANYGIAASSSDGPTDGDCGATPSDATEPPIEDKPCDLYAYDVETGDLSDLSTDANAADPAGAQVQGAVAISNDGSHVYFAALGQLVPGKGRTYAQNIDGEGSANVYLAHDGSLSYVTTLEKGNGDLLGSGSGSGSVLMRRPLRWSAEASANGRRLLFESAANLVGNDTGGGKAAYLYSADTGQLTCVSCRPDGQPSLSPPSLRVLATGRGPNGTDRHRSMSEDGRRIFFSSFDVLAPGAEGGESDGNGNLVKTSIYQWQNGQIRFLAFGERSGGNGLGGYLDASADGDDVFIATARQLVSQDRDFVSDAYDVRVDGGFPPEAVPTPCDPAADECQGPAAAQPGAPSPASASFVGAGNPPVSRPRPKHCRKGRARRRGRCVRKRAHARAKRAHGRAANNNRGGVK
jgi:Tol biopolymer transport system component